MARIPVSKPVAPMCPIPRGPPRQTRLAVLAATYSDREHNCDNLIFRHRAALDQLGERLLDANRTIGQPDKITVIFGRKITKHYRGKLQTVLEDLALPNPVIRSHYGHGFIKQCVRDHLLLRTEPATNNVNDHVVNKAIEHLPVLR